MRKSHTDIMAESEFEITGQEDYCASPSDRKIVTEFLMEIIAIKKVSMGS